MMSWTKEISDIIGIEEDQFKAIFALILSIVISPFYRIVTNRNGRNAFSIIIGFAILHFLFAEWAFIILACTVIPFFLCRISSKPFFVSIICSVIMLLIVHGYRFVTNYSIWKVDSSVAIMLLVAKLTYYGKWLEKRVKDEISFVDYLSYTLFVPSVIAGPTFSFEVYLAYLENKFDVSFKKMKVLKALEPLAVAIPLMGLGVYIVPTFHTRWVLQSEFYLSLGFLSKIVLMIVVGFFYRLKYYTAWYFAQGGINLSGLSLDAEGQYSTVRVASLKFETETNLRARTEYWNTSNQVWLKEVVYYGWKEYTSEQIAFFGTFLTSAFWHGLYLTYYVGFLYWGILVHINKWAYKWSQTVPKFANSRVADVGAFVAGGVLFAYIGMFMAILNWDDAVAFHAGVHYWGTYVLLGLLVCSFVIVPPRRKAEKKSE